MKMHENRKYKDVRYINCTLSQIAPVLYTVGLYATFWNMDSNVWAILVVWPGKAAVDSLVDRLSKGGKPKFKYFSS